MGPGPQSRPPHARGSLERFPRALGRHRRHRSPDRIRLVLTADVTAAFFQWCDHTAIGAAIRDSVWLFPVVEVFHLLALGLLGGTVLLIDLRLRGLGLRRQSVRELAADLRPWMLKGFWVMIASGILMSYPKRSSATRVHPSN